MQQTEYRAYVQREFNRDGWLLQIGGLHYRGRADVLRSDGTWETIEDGHMATGPTGIFLPRDSWQAIQNLVHPPMDIKYLEEALKIERARLDNVLGKLLP